MAKAFGDQPGTLAWKPGIGLHLCITSSVLSISPAMPSARRFMLCWAIDKLRCVSPRGRRQTTDASMMAFIVAKAQLAIIISLVRVDWGAAAKAGDRNDVLASHSVGCKVTRVLTQRRHSSASFVLPLRDGEHSVDATCAIWQSAARASYSGSQARGAT